MDIQRTITIVIQPDSDLERTIEAFREVKHSLSEHCFTCPHYGHVQHADINAAYNIHNRFTLFRESGFSSMNPEAQSSLSGEHVGKPLPF